MAQGTIPSKEMMAAIQDLQTTDPKPALYRLAVLFAILAPLGFLLFTTPSFALFLALSFVFSVFYTPLAITTHDAIHHTFTGNPVADEVLPRLISIPMLWPHGVYAELHKIHHKMNATNADDPERCMLTESEVERLGRWGSFYKKYQLPLNIFVFGGFGMIFKTLKAGLFFSKRSNAVRKQLKLDLLIVVGGNALILLLMASQGLALRYVLFFLVLERVMGGFMQFRTHIEHYGLWGKKGHHFETQIAGCRNIETHPLVSWFFNGLNFHSMHHAFPLIPFYRLKEAHERLDAVYHKHSSSIPSDKGYWKTMWKLMKTPTTIKTHLEK